MDDHSTHPAAKLTDFEFTVVHIQPKGTAETIYRARENAARELFHIFVKYV